MDSIKLIIWDLDETLWGGTLSEGGITRRPEAEQAVVELSRRGIVNSICSKNDLDRTRDVLREIGLWEYFVFPQIAWQPKGQMIARIIEDMGLRAANVLLLDDNPQNLEEAKYYSPGLQTAHPDALAELLQCAALRGKSDPELSRLRQYQLLERKVVERGEFTGENEEFLRQCQIVVKVHHDCQTVFDRLLEMVERTNQLNYTKRRSGADELRGILADPAVRSGYVTARDRYGDYDICGFYAVQEGRLLHFLFSCRVLNMGIERWLYRRLNAPALEIQGEVSDDPLRLPPPDWIGVDEGSISTNATTTLAPRRPRLLPRILLKGGCDLEQVIDFLGRSPTLVGEFNYVSSRGVPIHREHTEILRRFGPDVWQRSGDVLDKLPFFDRESFSTRFFSVEFDTRIYSPLMDYSNGLYRHLDTDLVIPYGDFKQDITCEEHWPYLLSREKYGLDRAFLEWFRQEFHFEGCLTPERFKENLRWLAAHFGPEQQLIFLNGAEVASPHLLEVERPEHHRTMNLALEQVVAELPNVSVCDVRKFVRSERDVTNNIRHYGRRVHFQIAGEIQNLIAARWSQPVHRWTQWLRGATVVLREALYPFVERCRYAVGRGPRSGRARGKAVE